MTRLNITFNLVDLFGAIFCVNVLTHTVKGFKPSNPKIMYCVLLLSLFAFNFYVGTKSILPKREGFSMKQFLLWIMLSIQLMSPILTLTEELLRFKDSAFEADLIVKVDTLACNLGYQRNVSLTEKYKKKSEAFIRINCLMNIIYLLFMLYPYDTNFFTHLQILVQSSVCVLFDIINLIHQAKFLQTIRLYSIFLKQTIQSYRFWRLDKTAKVSQLETVRVAQSLLSKSLVLFNSKYYASLLFTCMKTVVAMAAIVSDFLVEKIFLSFLLFGSETDERSIENGSLVDLLWSTYYFMFLLYTCHIHSSTTMEVNNMASVVHDILTYGKVDDIADELLDFSVEILHTDFHFSAFEFFKVDYTLMFRVLSSTVSYMVILIQFQFQTLSRFYSSSASLSSLLLAYADTEKTNV